MNNNTSIRQRTYYRVLMAVVFGLIGFGINFLDIELYESPGFKVNILLGLIFPMIIAQAWGWRYGLLSALAGGCQTMWWLWYTDGYGFLYAVPVFTLWVVWHGYWTDFRRNAGKQRWFSTAFAVEVPFRIIIEFGFYTIFRWLVSLNPPTWAPSITWNYVTLDWVNLVVIKHIITSYLILIIAHVFLRIAPVRRFLGLKKLPVEKIVSGIYGGALLVSALMWIMDGVAGYLFFNTSGQTFWEITFFNVDSRSLFMRYLYFVISLCVGAIIAYLFVERKKIEERIIHLSLVLRAIRDVNQLITHEKNRGKLIREVCSILTGSRGYSTAWIMLLDKSGKYKDSADYGMGKNFKALHEQLEHGVFPACFQQARSHPGVLEVTDPSSTCASCPITRAYPENGRMTIQLEFEGNLLGVLSISAQSDIALDREEIVLFEEVAGDISYALHYIEVEEEKNRQTRDLNERIKELGCLYGVSTIIETPGISLPEILQESVELLPDAWQDSKNTCARIAMNDHEYKSGNFRETKWKMTSGIQVDDARVGSLEIYYLKEWPEEHKGPFLKEERELLNEVSDRLGKTIMRIQAEEKIHTLNAELEQRVIERTAQLESANRELEAFTYSVSHDLRAPLRSMDGFSKILVDGYKKQLPKEAQHYLDRVQESSAKMGNLINDLLLFSRTGNQALKIQEVNCTDIVEQVLGELQIEYGDREIEVTVGKLPDLLVDPSLIRQVFTNLLSNAFKFTRMKKNARIEIGSKNIKDEITIFVKDNGAGFDMSYANKLFGVFQRLHSATEYEGTGVGLAIAQRIIQRHGGKVWAEAEVDQGAVFYFTVGGKDEKRV